MNKAILLAVAVLASPTSGDGAISFCEVATPIYVQVTDYQYLQSTVHGRSLLDNIELHNQKIIDLCGDLPRTMFDR